VLGWLIDANHPLHGNWELNQSIKVEDLPTDASTANEFEKAN
jgi:hypothetical protein